MAGVDIQAKVKRGLARAVNKTGSGYLVYLVKETQSGGTPINPPTITTENILLVDAIFKNININQMTNTLIQEGDRELVTNSDVLISVNDKIQQGGRKMYVVSTKPAEPAGVVLVYKSIVRDV